MKRYFKALKYVFTKQAVLRKAEAIQKIRNLKEGKIRTAITFIRQWQGAPLTHIYIPVCQILGVKPSDKAWNYISNLCFPRSLNMREAIRTLPL